MCVVVLVCVVYCLFLLYFRKDMSLVVRCLLFVVYYVVLALIGCCWLCGVCRLQFVVCCLSFVGCCVLYVACGLLFVVCRLWSVVVRCALLYAVGVCCLSCVAYWCLVFNDCCPLFVVCCS